MSFDHRIASDHASSFLALAADGTERIVTASPSLDRPVVGDYVAIDAGARIAAIAPRRGVLARARADRGNARADRRRAISTSLHRHLARARLLAAARGAVPRCRAGGRHRAGRRAQQARSRGRPDELVTELVIVAGDAPVHAVSAVHGTVATLLVHTPRRRDARAGRLVRRREVDAREPAPRRRASGDRRDARERRARRPYDDAARAHRVAVRCWLLDTPGMRAFAPWADADALDDAFADVAEAAGRCRFRDCAHGPEPGCAINAEIDDRRAWRDGAHCAPRSPTGAARRSGTPSRQKEAVERNHQRPASARASSRAPAVRFTPLGRPLRVRSGSLPVPGPLP